MAKVGKQLMEQATTGKLKIVGEQNEQTNEILTPEALELVLALHEKFDARRKELLEARQERQNDLMRERSWISYQRQSIFGKVIG